MPDQLTIRNFQKHRHLVVPLAGVTTITGESDRGKSAIIRALLWVLTNAPTGDDFITHGAPGCAVTLELGGHVLKRSRARKGPNYYRLDGQTYTSFATQVPEQIARWLRLRAINFQPQHEPSFWFHLSPAEAARRLNAIIDLSLIDDAQQHTSATLKRATAAMEFTRERLDLAEKARAELAYVPELVEFVDELVAANLEYERERNVTAALADYIAEAETLADQLKNTLELPDPGQLDAQLQEYHHLQTTTESLAEDIRTTQRCAKAERAAHEAFATANTDLAGLAGETCPECGQIIP